MAVRGGAVGEPIVPRRRARPAAAGAARRCGARSRSSSTGRRRARAARRRSGRRGEAAPGPVHRDDDGVEGSAAVVGGAQLDPVVTRLDGPDRQAQVERDPRALEQRLHVGATAANDGAPALAPEAEHPVVVEETERVAGGEVDCRPRAARPDRCGQGDEEVVAKLLGVAVRRDVAADQRAGGDRSPRAPGAGNGPISRISRSGARPKGRLPAYSIPWCAHDRPRTTCPTPASRIPSSWNRRVRW